MKNKMKFHYGFVIFICCVSTVGTINLLLFPINVMGLINAYRFASPGLGLYWEMFFNAVLSSLLCLVGWPLFHSLVNRVNFSLKQLHLFFIFYALRALNQTLFSLLEWSTTQLNVYLIFNTLLSFGLLALIFVLIDRYYKKRESLFKVNKELGFLKGIIANLSLCTNGFISTHREGEKD